VAGQTQIGVGAVVLTANADALLTGLDKAKHKTDVFARDTAKKLDTATSARGSLAADASKKFNATAGMVGKIPRAVPVKGSAKDQGGAGAGGAGAGPSVGGMAGGLIVGGPAGAIAAVGLKLASTVYKAFAALPNAIRDITEASGQGAGGPLARISKAIESITKAGAVLIARVLSPLAPAFESLADAADMVGETFAPIFDAIGEFFGGVMLSGANLFRDSWAGIGRIIENVAPLFTMLLKIWNVLVFVASKFAGLAQDAFASVVGGITSAVGGLDNINMSLEGVGKAIFAALRLAGAGVARLWDDFAYLLTVVALTGGAILKVLKPVFAWLGSEIAKALNLLALGAMAAGFDETSAKLRGAADAAAGIGDGIDAAAARMDGFARKAHEAIGKAAPVIEAALDKWEMEFNVNVNAVKAAKHNGGVKPEMSGALEFKSTGAFSLIAKNNVLGAAGGIERQQLNELKRANVALQKVAAGIANGRVIGVM